MKIFHLKLAEFQSGHPILQKQNHKHVKCDTNLNSGTEKNKLKSLFFSVNRKSYSVIDFIFNYYLMDFIFYYLINLFIQLSFIRL